MTRSTCLILCATLCVWPCGCEVRPESRAAAAANSIELLGSCSIGGETLDRSGLEGLLEDGTPRARLGGFGSALAWTGHGTLYLALCDRGPGDGSTTFPDRFDEFDIRVEAGKLAATLRSTCMLVDPLGRAFVGDRRAFEGESPLRLDPEGLRIGRAGNLYVSDEYGPSLLEFDALGHCLRRLPVPGKFSVPHPAADKEEQLADNTHGRRSNKGFEGLAITPDGGTLYALLQSPLIQDHGRDGRLCRMLELTIASGKTHEFAVPLERAGLSFTELVAIDARRFLALERDIRGASDVSALESLPALADEHAPVCVARRPFLDLLDPSFGLAGAQFPEKVEGLAFGPDLPDGRRLLLISSDNDFKSGAPSWIWAFAVSPAALIEPQR